MQRSSINLMKCCEMHNQKSRVKKLSLNAGNEFKMTRNNKNLVAGEQPIVLI